MVEESADKSDESFLINIHESVPTCLWKTTLVCLGLSYGGVACNKPEDRIQQIIDLLQVLGVPLHLQAYHKQISSACSPPS